MFTIVVLSVGFVHHCSLLGFFFPVELCSCIRSHLRSPMFDCHVSLCYVSFALDICCVLYVGSFSWCLAM
jgi:hypothetical protein